MGTQLSRTFHGNMFHYRLNSGFRFGGSKIGFIVISLVLTWNFGVADRYKFTFRHFFNEKLIKYIPIESGGNALFPFQLITALGHRECPKTQWNSFDQRSFFPHTDAFKMKIAICHEDLPLISTLLSREFDVNSIIDSKKQWSPIGLAASLGRVELIEFFFSHGSGLNLRDFEGNTPLMLAIIYDHPAAVKKLIKLGASLDARDRYGYTAMDKARNRGKDTIAEYLENITQQETAVIVNPITYKLEDYEYLDKRSAEEIIKKYKSERYYKPIMYPYYKSSQGFLVYFFGGFDLENLDFALNKSGFLNLQDDRCSSDQQLFTFGEMFNEK